MELFAVCPVCTRACDVRTRKLGTFLSVEQRCPHCKFCRHWNSQPVLGSTPAGNLHLSAAVYLSGASFSKIARVNDVQLYFSQFWLLLWIWSISDEAPCIISTKTFVCFFFLPTGLQGDGAATFSVRHISPACQIFHWTCSHSPLEHITGCDAAAAQSGEQSYTWWWHESWLCRYLHISEIVQFIQVFDILWSSKESDIMKMPHIITKY